MEEKLDIVIKRLRDAKFEENILCSEFWRKLMHLHENFNEQQLWDMLTQNIQWILANKVISSDDLVNWFTEEELNKHFIFTKGAHQILDGFAIGFGKAKIKAEGLSRVVLFDQSFCEAFDKTYISAYHQSSMDINDCVGETFNQSKAVVTGFAKVEAWDQSKIKAENYSYIIQHDDASVEKTKNVHVVKI